MANINLFNTIATIKTVIVHGGLFHLDDVLLVAIVKKAFPDVTVVRNNKPDLTTAGPDTGIIIADVGGKFDPDHWIFDHHHLKFKVGDDDATAAVGLLWNTLGNKDVFPGLTALIHAVDLHDTGAAWNAALASLGAFAPNWDDPTTTLDAAFDAAVAWVSALLDAVIKKDLAALKAVDLLDALPINDGILVLPKFIPGIRITAGENNGLDVILILGPSGPRNKFG